MLLVTQPKRAAKRQLSVQQKKSIAAAIEQSPEMFKRDVVRQYARSCGVGESTVYEWWLKYRTGELVERVFEDPALEDLDEILTIFYAHKGVVASACVECKQRGLWNRSERQFHRFLQSEVDRMIRLAAGEDELAARLLGQYVAYTVPHRDYEWQIDLVDLCVQIDIGRQGTAHGWAVVILDKRTGLVRGWCLTAGQPTADAVVAALVMAVRPRTEVLSTERGDIDVTVGGAPNLLRTDNGTQMVADLVTMLMAEVGTVVLPTGEYEPTAKGSIERFNRDAKGFSKNIFGTTRGPKTVRGKNLFQDPSLVLTAEELEGLFGELVHEHDRAVKRGEALSPLAQYAADPHVPFAVPESVLARFQLTAQPRLFRIERGCVRFRNMRWTALEIPELRGDTMEIWVSNVDPSYVEGRAEGWRFVLTPADQLDPDAVEAVLDGRAERVEATVKLKQAGAAHNKATTAAKVGRDTDEEPTPEPRVDASTDEAEPDGAVLTTDDLLAHLDSSTRTEESP